MPGSPGHLARRFFDVVSAQPLTSSEVEIVNERLRSELAEVFFAQSPADQRHGFHAAQIASVRGGAPDTVVAALLHDIGKRHARLGAIGRSVASVLIVLHLPLTERMRAYRDHGLTGAVELARIGAPSLAIDFAMHHHGRKPPTIDHDMWDLLVEADEPPKALGRRHGRITSTGT